MAEDVVKLRTLRGDNYSELSRWAQSSITSILIRGRQEEVRKTSEEMMMGRWRQRSEWWGLKPRNMNDHQKLDVIRNGVSLEPLRKQGPVDILISNSWFIQMFTYCLSLLSTRMTVLLSQHSDIFKKISWTEQFIKRHKMSSTHMERYSSSLMMREI